ncbi:MAG: ATP-binding protein [Acidimicrobiia bacterium]|nr:ATP-binding protein [Acidimicrobiia bacterium]
MTIPPAAAIGPSTSTSTAASDAVLVTSMIRALAVFRWVTLGGAVIGVILGRSALVEPVAAVVLLGAATGLTGYLYLLGRRRPTELVRWSWLALEVGLGLTLLVADGLVFSDERAQSLPWAWPAAGIAAVGIAAAGRGSSPLLDHAGLLVAVVVGTVSVLSEIVLLGRFSGPDQIGVLFSKIGLWLLVGLLVGPLMRRLLRAERLISVAKAREELARELHDGVLQTLAVVQRRSDDPDLAALARDQENSLRTYLSDDRLIGAAAAPSGRLGEAAVDEAGAGLASMEVTGGLDAVLRRVATDAERRHRLKTQVVVAADCPPLSPAATVAVAGAVTEAVTNAAKHGAAERVTIFAEPNEGDDGATVFVSVHDNGSGFVVDGIIEGIGLSRSIRGRISEQGGRVEIASRPGKGTEVKLWVKADSRWDR